MIAYLNTNLKVNGSSPRGGVTTIYAGTGCAIFWGAVFRAENKFWGITFGKITSSHKFWGVILEKYLFRVLILINFHLVG